MKKARWIALAAVGLVVYAGVTYAWKRGMLPTRAVDWQRATEPGRLSAAHAYLEDNCAACHTAVRGADSAKCMACHAGSESLLTREPTAFHASIDNCRNCHPEHLGPSVRPTSMDHAALAHLGLQLLRKGETGSESRLLYDRLNDAMRQAPSERTNHKRISPAESMLSCAACHSTKDRHRTLFGNDCASCHSTQRWTIPEFKHPSAKSMDCAQCHQAPPSHYMMHFHMVSMRVAGQHHARVDQCYMCHQTTAWNDIKNVGWYKHH